MAITTNTSEIEINSDHKGYMEIKRIEENGVWLEIKGCDDYPLIIETADDIDVLCKILQGAKKLLK